MHFFLPKYVTNEKRIWRGNALLPNQCSVGCHRQEQHWLRLRLTKLKTKIVFTRLLSKCSWKCSSALGSCPSTILPRQTLSDIFNIWQSWLNYQDFNPVSIYRSSSVWSQRWHSYTWKTLIIHQDEAKQLVCEWPSFFLVILFGYKRLGGTKSPWQAVSSLLLPCHQGFIHSCMKEHSCFSWLHTTAVIVDLSYA